MNLSAQTLIDRTGEWGVSTVRTTTGMVSLFIDSVIELFKSGKQGYSSTVKQITMQILFTGVEAFWLVGMIGLLCGITIIVQATTNMPKFGVGSYFGNILIIVVIRELGPFFTALVVIGRSGAGLATYIGNMRVAKEISALEVMGVNPTRFLVMPALVAMVISTICLAAYFDVIAIIGGYFVAQLNVEIPIGIFMGTVLDALTWQEIAVSMFKNFIFGSFIAIFSCYYGLNVSNIREVPQAALKSVVSSMIAIIIINVLATIITIRILS
jgi:phospholipid/cholesterol/gamma-HCH transport system permease protein